MKKVIFLDDDPDILAALQARMRKFRSEWLCSFYSNHNIAFEYLSQNKVSIVFCDMQMPECDGATFLSKVKQVSPETMRVAFSGETDPEQQKRMLNFAHKHLEKPSSTIEIENLIRQAIIGRKEEEFIYEA